jgi:hypothetical protein
MEHPSESTHWYDKDGTPAYTVIGKNGKERPTDLRDARKLNLVPSVTTILKLIDKPGLTEWKINQAILSALTCPRLNDEPETAYLSRIKKDAQEQAKKAAERGVLIHSWVQDGFEGIVGAKQDLTFYENARAVVDAECGPQEWICEKSFATDKFGGKCDLHNDCFLLDIKTTDKDIDNLITYQDQHMQMASYDVGLPQGREGIWTLHRTRKCGILYINSISAKARIVWVTEKEIHKGLNMFNALVDLYYAKTEL